MPEKKIGLGFILCALAGLAVFLIVNVVPLDRGDGFDEFDPSPGISRAEAEKAAERFVRERLGWDEGDVYRTFAVYIAEREAVGYLNKSGLLEESSERFETVLPLDLFRVEVANSLTGAVHYVDINPYTGKAAAWEFFAAGEHPSEPADGETAERLIRETLLAMGWEEEHLALSCVSETDGVIRCKIADPAFGDAAVSILAQVSKGLGVSSLAMDWDVPAVYNELVERQDSLSSLFGGLGLFLSAVLQFAAFIYALARMKEVNWSRGAFMAFLFGVIYCVNNLNMYPGLKASAFGWLDGEDAAAPADDAGGIIAELITIMLIVNAMTLAMAIGMYFSTVAGDRLARRHVGRVWPSPQQTDYRRILIVSAAKGYLFAPVMLGVQSILLLLAKAGFGYWVTIDALSSLNNMMYPQLLPLLAWCAALEEEAVYRLFAIPALAAVFARIGAKLGRFRRKAVSEASAESAAPSASAAKASFKAPAAAMILAVVISSMIWALGHVQYPVYPYYTRFAEVTALGLLFAYIFMRHGFFTAIFTHALFDLVWMGLALVNHEPSLANIALFVLYLATPALAAGLLGMRRSKPPSLPAG